jgi:hypothetical protein
MNSHRIIVLPGLLLLIVLLFSTVESPSPSYAASNGEIEQAATRRAPRATATPDTDTYYTTGSINSRECPRLTCDVVERFTAGTAVEVTGTEEGDSVSGSKEWYIVLYEDQEIYIHSSLLSTRKLVPPMPTRNSSTGSSGSSGSSSPATSTPAPDSIAPISTAVIPEPTTPPVQGAACPGLQYTCSQLTCEQAYACLAAGGGDLDRDNDGKPCETQCGG